MGRRPGRPRAGQEPLGRERILAAALALVDEQGLAALSMRRLAAALGVDPMAIYHHLPGKAALVSALVERVFGELRLPPAAGRPWRERVREFAEAYRGLALAHPNLVLAIVSDAAAATQASLHVSEPLYAALEETALPPATVGHAAALVVDYVHGYALAEAVDAAERAARDREFSARVAALPEEQSPAMRRVFAAMTGQDEAESFAAGIDIILRGIEATVSRRVRPEA